MITTSIRHVTVSDIKSLARVHVDSWCETYQDIIPKVYLESLKYTDKQSMWEKLIPRRPENGGTLVVLDDEANVIGFCDFGPAREHEHGIKGEIYAIYLLKRFQGKGYGRALINAVKEEFSKRRITDFYLWVLKDNPTKEFYKHLGGEYIKSAAIEVGGTELVEELYLFEI